MVHVFFFAFKTQRECLVSQRHRKCELNSFFFQLISSTGGRNQQKLRYVPIMAHYQAGHYMGFIRLY